MSEEDKTKQRPTGFGGKRGKRSTGFGANKSVNGHVGQVGLPYRNPVEGNPRRDGIEFTGDPEKDTEAELEGIQKALTEREKGFRERKDKEQQRFDYAVDASFYCVLCFQSVEEMTEFLASVGQEDKLYRDRYLDGYEFAEAVGHPLRTKRTAEGPEGAGWTVHPTAD